MSAPNLPTGNDLVLVLDEYAERILFLITQGTGPVCPVKLDAWSETYPGDQEEYLEHFGDDGIVGRDPNHPAVEHWDNVADTFWPLLADKMRAHATGEHENTGLRCDQCGRVVDTGPDEPVRWSLVCAACETGGEA